MQPTRLSVAAVVKGESYLLVEVDTSCRLRLSKVMICSRQWRHSFRCQKEELIPIIRKGIHVRRLEISGADSWNALFIDTSTNRQDLYGYVERGDTLGYLRLIGVPNALELLEDEEKRSKEIRSAPVFLFDDD